MKIYANELDGSTLEKSESILFAGNGHLGVRGSLDEQAYTKYKTNRSTFLNGFYESHEIKYPEKLHGFPEIGESMIGVPDLQTTKIIINGEAFSVETGEMLEHERYLDMQKGIIFRHIVWKSPKGFVTEIEIERLVSFVEKSLFYTSIEINRINHDKEIMLETSIKFKQMKTIDVEDPRTDLHKKNIQISDVNLALRTLNFKTLHSHLSGELRWETNGNDITTVLSEQEIIVQEKYPNHKWVKKSSYAFGDVKHSSLTLSFCNLKEKQRTFLENFWNIAKVEIDSKYKLEESVNYGIYALLSSVGNTDRTSIAAKGLSGSGYEGHFFWDTEMYMLPLFIYSYPELAKSIIGFRISTLPAAKKNAKNFGYEKGALYPWRTISGIESSTFFEAGSAQVHINSDIAISIIRYYDATLDMEFLLNGGFEVLLETARFFEQIGFEKDGSFHINNVSGPDEYTVLGNNNYYTNIMIKHHYLGLLNIVEIIKKWNVNIWEELSNKVSIAQEELDEMQRHAHNIVILKDETLQVLKQDASFLDKQYWPFQEDKRPLLLYYHPLTIYRYQICKQADTVMGLMMFPNEQNYDITKNTIEYYDKITTHDSSLSYSVFSIVYSHLGQTEKAFDYFMKNCRTDLDDLHGNTFDGIHTASMGGNYLSILYGFAGATFEHGKFKINPHLPKEIYSLTFKVMYRGTMYRVHMNHEQKTYELEEI